jgi:hypothetical protein
MKAIVLAIIFTAGCATTPPADRESVEYERADAQLTVVERFEAFQEACQASGGTVYVDRGWGGNLRTPRDAVSDGRTAKCATALSRVQH